MALVIRTAITLREGEDDDLIKAFNRVPPRKRAAFIKAAMRAGGIQVDIGGLPDDDELIESMEQFLS
jgi:hypothetical protein